MRRHLRWPLRRPADGQQRAHRREGDGTRSRGLISSSRRIFSTALVGSYPLVPTRFTRVHFSSPVSSMCLRAKRPPEDTRWPSSRGTAPRKKASPAAQRTGGHQRVTTRNTTGGLTTPTNGTDPETQVSGRSVPIQKFARDASHTIAVGSQGFGLYKSLRSPVALKKQICDPFVQKFARDAEQWKRNDPNC